MASTNYFQHASRPYQPDTPRLSARSDQSSVSEDGDYFSMYASSTHYHGLGISGIYVPTSSIDDDFQLPSPVSDSDDSYEEHDQFKIPTYIDEEMMTMAHDRSRHRRQQSQEKRQSNQALKQIMFAASDLTSDDRMSRRGVLSPRFLSSQFPSPDQRNACHTPEPMVQDSPEYWQMCLMMRDMGANGNYAQQHHQQFQQYQQQQYIPATPRCNDGFRKPAPMTPVPFTLTPTSEIMARRNSRR